MLEVLVLTLAWKECCDSSETVTFILTSGSQNFLIGLLQAPAAH